MKRPATIIVSLSVCLACGESDQMSHIPSENPDISEPVLIADADASVKKSPSEPVIPTSESEEPVQPSVPPMSQEEQKSEPDPKPSKGNGEAITPPQQVTGTYLFAEVLKESETAVDIKLVVYQDGARASLDPTRYEVQWNLSQPNDPSVKVAFRKPMAADQDTILSFEGLQLASIKEQYKVVSVFVTVVDKLQNVNKLSAPKTVAELLSSTTSRPTLGLIPSTYP